ncbi:MAG TPA: hypothetical protein VHQ65_14570 [Thermoanaerobaculia bacterium]|nr:hypothetical protein [Thermoanaerobaculia bacterium]
MALAGPLPEKAGDVSEVLYDGRAAYWRVFAEHEAVVLTIHTPCGTIERLYEAGKDPAFSIEELAPDDPDGAYTWQVRIQPVVSPDVRKELARSRATGDEEIVRNLARKGLLPQGPFVQSGSFRVIDGTIVAPGDAEEEEGRTVKQIRAAAGAAQVEGVEVVTAADQVIPDDLIVQGSICVGFDCVNNESFGFDTIRLKENNLRIKFEDTSAGTFPSNDWQLTANDSASGGANKFSIEDITGARVPFTIEAGATTNSLYVDSTGRVGFRTATPVLDLHVSTSNTPGIRLEQTSAGGFTAQTWDIAGNEANFFVRDVTGGSRLPFRIRPGAPTSAIDISNDGDVGFGTTSPDAAVDIERNGAGAAANLLRLTNTNGPTRLEFRDSTNAIDWDFRTTSGDTFVITQPTSPSNDFQINSNGDVVVRGTLTTGGPTCSTGCDAVLGPSFPVESITEHAAQMFANSYLPAVGPTVPHAPMNISEKTGGILNELEKAHIYIVQLHERLEEKEASLNQLESGNTELLQRVERLEQLLLQQGQ